MTDAAARNETSVPLVDALADRWSPRGFDASHVISDDDLTALGEAARWAPSASNTQPWHFIVGTRGTKTFETIHANLMQFNRGWTPSASVLIVAVAETNRDGSPLRWAEYDLGQAVAHLTVEAEARGLNVRQMGGFEAEGLSEAFDLAVDLVPVTVIAVGRFDASEAVPADVRERDAAARDRRALEDIAIVLDK